ncbi:TBC1 domain family member 25 [Dryobates pubescens]|uniref:TBC1 domain family member 25 n=1 Tax=Dryobates pubescens TaxID=118200 RepID=UPI0023B8F06E|nr:TBC1 domain family member 25 [Dryobates pubescens]
MATGGGASPGGGASLEEEREVVRVRVKKVEGQQPPEFRSFAVDPQITSLDVLQHILARAFDLQGRSSFSLSFWARDAQGQEGFLPLLSDGDLAAAFSGARPGLSLRLDVRQPPESPLLEDWDIISPREVAGAEPGPERRSLLAAALPLTQALLAQLGRTLARAQAALSWPEASSQPVPALPVPPQCSPLGDLELRSFLGPGGRLQRPQDLRLRVFHGGVEPGLRKVVWRYLLNIFPAELSGQERLSHLRRKACEYEALKGALLAWAPPGQLALVSAAVRKDVVRTDRGHPYFGGPEEGHPHLQALQDLLTTFALGHPRLSYCQGMSDVASPLLAVLDDEAQAFLCFCSLMRRLGPRFRPGGRGLAKAFGHLRRLLRRLDPGFWSFLAARGAHDLLFCYRWLLLELKREFPFEDALRVLEITWSSLPPAPPPPPEGVPLLGAPPRGREERGGMRPRLPGRRRRRRRRRKDGEGLKSSKSDQEAPRNVQEGLKSSKSDQEAPRNIQEGLKSSKSDQEAPRNIQEGPKSSRDGQEGPRKIQEWLRSFTELQEGLQSSRGGQEGPRNTNLGAEVPKDPGGATKELCEDLQEVTPDHKALKEPGGTTKELAEEPQAPRLLKDSEASPKDPPEGPQELTQAPTLLKEPGGPPREWGRDPQVPKEVGGTTKGLAEDPQGLPQGLKVLREPAGATKELSEGLKVLKEPEGTTKELAEDPQGLSRDPKVSKEVGGITKELSEGPKALRDPGGTTKELSEGPKALRDPGGTTKEVREDLKVPEEPGGTPEELSEDLKVPKDPGGSTKELSEDPEPPPLDPWGGRWAWESSSSSSSCSSSSSSEEEELAVEDDGAPLPPPEELGQGNPFLLFLCLAMLLEQRQALMAQPGDYNEVGQHFHRLLRRHRLDAVLQRAKGLFAAYLEGWGGGQQQ